MDTVAADGELMRCQLCVIRLVGTPNGDSNVEQASLVNSPANRPRQGDNEFGVRPHIPSVFPRSGNRHAPLRIIHPGIIHTHIIPIESRISPRNQRSSLPIKSSQLFRTHKAYIRDVGTGKTGNVDSVAGEEF